MKTKAIVRWLVERLALVGFSVLISLIALEIGLRVIGIGSDQLLQQDPILGVRLSENKSGLSQNTCYRANPTTNSQGWRGEEVPVDRPEDVVRVLVIGDSFMAGLQVEDDQIFTAQLQKLLNEAQLQKRVEVINFGVPSYGTDQEYLTLRHFGAAYDPDIVVLAFYSQNDVKNNSMVLERKGSAYPKPFFDLENGKLVEIPFHDPTPKTIALVRRLVQPLRLYPWLRNRLMNVPAIHQFLYERGIVGVVPSRAEPAKGSGKYPSRWESQRGAFLRSYDSDWDHAWDITYALVRGIRDEAQAMGSDLVVLGLSDPLTVIPPSTLAGEMPASMIAEMDRDKPTKLLAAFSESEEIDFLSLIPAFREAIGDDVERFDELYLSCDGHWTVAGNRLAAETVAAHLAPKLKARLQK